MATTAGPKPYKTTAEHVLLDCPVCLQPIKAEVTVEAVFGEAVVNGPSSVTLPVEPTMTAYNVMHACTGVPPVDPERISL